MGVFAARMFMARDVWKSGRSRYVVSELEGKSMTVLQMRQRDRQGLQHPDIFTHDPAQVGGSEAHCSKKCQVGAVVDDLYSIKNEED